MKQRLRELITGALAACPGEDPHVTARSLVAGLTDDELRPALECTLPLLVKQVHAQQGSTAVRPGSGPTGSWLERAVCVKNGRWKPLGDCSPSDLRRMARFRQTLVEQQLAWQRRYEHLADAVHDAGERRVRDLDPQVVRAIFMAEARGAA